MTIEMEFKFGQTVKDIVSGFSGTVTAFGSYITGSDQYLVSPKCDKDGNLPKAFWFDSDRLVPMTEEEVRAKCT